MGITESFIRRYLDGWKSCKSGEHCFQTDNMVNWQKRKENGLKTMAKRYKLIGCKILEREIASVTYNCKNIIDVTLIRQKLHDRPEKLREVLQEEIDAVDRNTHRYSNDTVKNDFDAILLGYGLCSNVVIGLHSENYPIVIPRVHDCISLFMGGREKYMEYYKSHKGTFYYTPGFVEMDCFDKEEEWKRRYRMYLIRYKGSEKKAKKAIEIERSFRSAYERMTYIKWNSLEFPEYEEEVKHWAEEKGWKYEILPGEDTLLKKLVDGDWTEEEFLVVPPGCQAEQSYEEGIILVK